MARCSFTGNCFFSAVAKGVLRHLKERAGDSIRMKVSVEQTIQQNSQHLIQSENLQPVTFGVGSGYGLVAQAGEIKVGQVSEPIKSEGDDFFIEEIRVEDVP